MDMRLEANIPWAVLALDQAEVHQMSVLRRPRTQIPLIKFMFFYQK